MLFGQGCRTTQVLTNSGMMIIVEKLKKLRGEKPTAVPLQLQPPIISHEFTPDSIPASVVRNHHLPT
jgi:hypothetical protein